nr:hypothetical protein HK105_002599 [Polyrhizophydium stewartii]
MEPGESIEEACRREVHEETGVRVGAVAYHSSQPWPFPSQLMIGCFAEATSDTITLVDGELEDAKWFSREEIRDAIAGRNGELKLASGASISFALIRAWAEGPIKARI